MKLKKRNLELKQHGKSDISILLALSDQQG